VGASFAERINRSMSKIQIFIRGERNQRSNGFRPESANRLSGSPTNLRIGQRSQQFRQSCDRVGFEQTKGSNCTETIFDGATGLEFAIEIGARFGGNPPRMFEKWFFVERSAFVNECSQDRNGV